MGKTLSQLLRDMSLSPTWLQFFSVIIKKMRGEQIYLSIYHNFKLAWKIAILLKLDTVKHCSVYTLLYIDNKHYFFGVMLLFLFLYLVV